ncbi:MAG: prolyl oligopeptidase family serine peptidase [Cyanobacteria bacterium SID2]|nr:prolyl oligopeptidase family serine peptidase [Cyanobacteria bacterium SID2]MBP0003615.1 prolyl oligopeptidase family serine peptidase [Cyanobacteria bacterium SBC]
MTNRNRPTRSNFALLPVFVLVICLESCSPRDRQGQSVPSNAIADASIVAESLAISTSSIDVLLPLSGVSSRSSPTPPIPSTSSPVSSSEIQPKVAGANVGWTRNLSIAGVAYDLYIPANYGNDLPCAVMLPGWDFDKQRWVNETNLQTLADTYGYILVLPQMGQTLYESAYYPETEMRWHPSLPGGEFIRNYFIPTMQQRHGLLISGQHNTLIGLSTGGRGVALIALENPGLFVAGASFSGDFSQDRTPDDRLMTAVYGAYDGYPERWTGRDNPQRRVSEWRMPLYLSHGTADDIVPESQSHGFYQALVNAGSGHRVEYHSVAGAGHDFSFWGGELGSAFEFFERVRGSEVGAMKSHH